MSVDTAVIVSDLHCGDQYGLCPETVTLDGGGTYAASEFQREMWRHWRYFWGEWARERVDGRQWALVLNGDIVEGRHHRATHQASQNMSVHARIARAAIDDALRLVGEPPARIYMVGGTEAHAGPSWEDEERLAEHYDCCIDERGARVRPDLWLRVGTGLASIAHHIGTTGSQAYETTALGKELVETLADSARWGLDVPDWIVRSHRHRSAAVSFATHRGESYVIVSPGWQGRTPWAAKIPGGRTSTPQIGGVLLADRDGQRTYDRYVVTCARSRAED